VTTEENIGRWSSLPEGQFFERKSAIDRSSGRPKRRNVREIAWDIAETLSAMANADGGELVVGLEDNGDVTGVAHPEDRLAAAAPGGGGAALHHPAAAVPGPRGLDRWR
jgi:predicted HTH transcriptional regulator